MINQDEKNFLENNIKNYKQLSIDKLIEKLEDYMQTKTSMDENDFEFILVENLIDKLVDNEQNDAIM